MSPREDRGTVFKLAIVCLTILLVGSFWLTVRMSSAPVSLVVVPEVARQGEPVLVTFKLNNPSSEVLASDYQFYADGKLLMEGATVIAPNSSKTYQYAYSNPLRLGEQLNFVVRAQSELGDYERAVSLPPYPPQVWSSFVSFASFSTSVMSSMSTMTYYRTTFSDNMGLNVGIIISIVLISLLIFLELTQPLLRQNQKTVAVLGLLKLRFSKRTSLEFTEPLLRQNQKSVAVLGKLRLKFSTVTWILFIIFMGIVYTRIVIILAT